MYDMWVEITTIVTVNTAESVSVSRLLISYGYMNIQIYRMMLTDQSVWLSIAMILISSQVTSEISGYIEYNYPTEHISNTV